MSKISRMTKDLKKHYKPVGDISDVSSLEDNFIYSLLINTKYGEQIQNYSPVEMSKWLKEQPAIQSDYDILHMIFDQ